MRISLIVAMARNRVIGRDNRLPWRLPADLAHFRRITLGKPVLMGRRTWESIGRPLPGRTNIVVSGNREFDAPGCIVAHSIDGALEAAGDREEVMVIGGTRLYEQMLPRAQRIYLTLVHGDFAGDAFFPELDPAEWRELERIDRDPDDRNPHPHSFLLLERVGPG